MAIGRSLRPAFSQTRLDLTGSIASATVAAMIGCMLDHEYHHGSNSCDVIAGEMNEPLYIRIFRKLKGHALINSSSFSIFKVPNHLRQINDKAYEPQVISIGPYHHGKEHLKAMEVHKMNSLKLLLRQGEEKEVEGYVTTLEKMEEKEVERYVATLEEMEKEARKFYSEPLDHIGREEFVEMMLLDGCFIIVLILQSIPNSENFIRVNANDRLAPSILRKVMRDLLLVENQLPFFVLSTLCSLSSVPEFTPDAVITIFIRIIPGRLIKERTGNQDVKHLLGLLHNLPYSSLYHDPFDSCLSPRSRGKMRKWQFIRSATELNEAGINFWRKSGVLFDIEFQNGAISIPALTINDDTESILRNLVAYEQCYEGISLKCFTDYITFMDCLINTGEDVELLCRCGVLDNWLGDNEAVATMFNRLRDSVLISEANFFYSEIFIRVNDHCHRKWNTWAAILKHNYFNTPGAFISFTTAFVLLLCTLLQTLFSIFPSNR